MKPQERILKECSISCGTYRRENKEDFILSPPLHAPYCFYCILIGTLVLFFSSVKCQEYGEFETGDDWRINQAGSFVGGMI